MITSFILYALGIVLCDGIIDDINDMNTTKKKKTYSNYYALAWPVIAALVMFGNRRKKET